MNSLVEIKNNEDFKKTLQDAKKDLVVVHFSASWSDQCEQMNSAMEDLAKQYVQVHFLKVEAEEMAEVSLQYEIVAVPTFIFIKNQQKIDKLDGAHVPELEKLVQRNLEVIAPTNFEEQSKTVLNQKLKSLINSAPCIVFMKGNADAPRCGFSKKMIELLRKNDCEFSTFDILEAPDVRVGLKEYSNWPTYPQLYVNGKLLGGLDIIKDMDEEGELADELPKAKKEESPEERIKNLIKKENIMLFMKGEPDAPRCGFSRKMIEILHGSGASFGHFDILSDETIRQELKKFSNWPTYPQLYVNGELLGGLDIVKEMQEEGELLEALKK